LIRLSHQCDDTGGKTQPEVFTDLITDASASDSESDLDTDKKSSTDNLDSNTKATAKELFTEQLSDSSLSTCWALALLCSLLFLLCCCACLLCSVPPLQCQTAVIYEKDDDFGDIIVPDTAQSISKSSLPSQRVDPSLLSHLDLQQRETLINILDSYSDCFSDIPGFCSLVEHTVSLMDNLVPKRLSPYKIPIKLRPQVQAQLQELQSLGIIQPSKSPMASPVICVLKGKDGKGGVRLAIDYRYVNKFTISDAYPTPDLADIIQEVGKYI